MTTTTDDVLVAPARLSYGQNVTAMFRRAADPEIKRADDAIAELDRKIDQLYADRGGWVRYKAELEQAVSDVEANATVPVMPPAAIGERGRCACSQQIVFTPDGWVHAGRELNPSAVFCWPDRTDSTAATPVARESDAR